MNLFIQCDGGSDQGFRRRGRSSMGSTGSEVDSSLSPSSTSSTGTVEKDVSIFLQRYCGNQTEDNDPQSFKSARSNSRKRHANSLQSSTYSRSRRSTSTDEEACMYCDTFQNERQYFLWRSQYVRSSFCPRCSEGNKEIPYISYWGKPSYENGSWRKRHKEGRNVDIDLTPLIEVLHRIDRIDTSMGKSSYHNSAYKTDRTRGNDCYKDTLYKSHLTRIADSRSQIPFTTQPAEKRTRRFTEHSEDDDIRNLEIRVHGNLTRNQETLHSNDDEENTDRVPHEIFNASQYCHEIAEVDDTFERHEISFKTIHDANNCFTETAYDINNERLGQCNISNENQVAEDQDIPTYTKDEIVHDENGEISENSRVETSINEKEKDDRFGFVICNSSKTDNIDIATEKNKDRLNRVSNIQQERADTFKSTYINNVECCDISDSEITNSQFDNGNDTNRIIFSSPKDRIDANSEVEQTEKIKSVKDIISNIEAITVFESNFKQNFRAKAVNSVFSNTNTSSDKANEHITTENNDGINKTNLAANSKSSYRTHMKPATNPDEYVDECTANRVQTKTAQTELTEKPNTPLHKEQKLNNSCTDDRNNTEGFLYSTKTKKNPGESTKQRDNSKSKEFLAITDFRVKTEDTDKSSNKKVPSCSKFPPQIEIKQTISKDQDDHISPQAAIKIQKKPITEKQDITVTSESSVRADGSVSAKSKLEHNVDCSEFANKVHTKETIFQDQNVPEVHLSLMKSNKTLNSSDNSHRSDNLKRPSPVPRYQQKRRLSRSQRDRRSSLQRVRLALEDEDDEFMQIQQKLNSLGKFSTRRAQMKPVEVNDTITIPKKLWNRSIRNAIYGLPQYSSCEASATNSDNHIQENTTALSQDNYEVIKENTKANDEISDDLRNEQNWKLDKKPSNADELDDISSSCSEYEKQRTSRYRDTQEPNGSIKTGPNKIEGHETLKRNYRNLEAAYTRVSQRSATNTASECLDSLRTERMRQTSPKRSNPKSAHTENTTSDTNGSCVELDTDDEQSNKLNWRSRGYSYDFYMSRQSRTGTEIIQQYKQSRSNRSSKTNSPASSAGSSRKSSTAERYWSKRSFRHLGSLEENTPLIVDKAGNRSPRAWRSGRRKSETSEKSGQEKEAETGINANLLKTALERAALCTARMDDRLEKQLVK